MVRTTTAVLAWPMMLSVVFAAAAGAAGVPQKVDSIPNYTVIRSGLAAAGQPPADVLASLKDLGFKTVINIRTAGEPGYVDESAVLAAQGIRYVHVPVTSATFSAADVDAVRAVIDDPASGPVLLHCASANRVGAVWAAIQAGDGKSMDEALAEGRRVGLSGESMAAAVRRVATRPSPR
jgi:uncharacterized protein (TIGR01244 family)